MASQQDAPGRVSVFSFHRVSSTTRGRRVRPQTSVSWASNFYNKQYLVGVAPRYPIVSQERGIHEATHIRRFIHRSRLEHHRQANYQFAWWISSPVGSLFFSFYHSLSREVGISSLRHNSGTVATKFPERHSPHFVRLLDPQPQRLVYVPGIRRQTPRLSSSS